MSEITPLSGEGAGSATATVANSDDGTSEQDFLSLLVAELQNQDPSNPADPTQMMSQTAQFTEIQQIEALGTQMSSLVTANQASTATSMLGRTVTSTLDGNEIDGVVSSVSFDNTGQPILNVGNAQIPLSAVVEVK